MVLTAFSQTKEETESQEKWEVSKEEIWREPADDYSVPPFYLENGTEFKVSFAPQRLPPIIPDPGIMVYTNITDPSGNVTTKFVLLGLDPSGTRQVLYPGDWIGRGVANITGEYKISIFSDVVDFARLTVSKLSIEEGKVSHPYSFLYFPGIAVVGLGIVLSLFGALSSKGKRIRRKGHLSKK